MVIENSVDSYDKSSTSEYESFMSPTKIINMDKNYM